GFDGFGPCTAGTQSCESSLEGSASSWGNCVGAVAPQVEDSCVVIGDDANCNGASNDGCECRTSADCEDSFACTIGSCVELACAQEIAPQACLIDGVCLDAFERHPTDSCRYCDPSANHTEWTVHEPRAITVSNTDGGPGTHSFEFDSPVQAVLVEAFRIAPPRGQSCSMTLRAGGEQLE